MAALTIFVGGSRDQRHSALRQHLDVPGLHVLEPGPVAAWPFQRHVTPAAVPAGRVAILARDLHHAFPAGQTSGTRLVLTQSTYQLRRWHDWLERRPDASFVADADRSRLAKAAPEAFSGRGPWAQASIVELDGDVPGSETPVCPSPLREVCAAFHQAAAEQRLAACERATAADRSNAPLQLALASACMELQRLDDAQRALERALATAPDWEAVHFEQGKLWLRRDDTERAAAAFAEAGRLMPGFSAALTNLGSALGELDRGDESLHVLRQALRYDPRSHTILGNIGAVYRELGRLDDAEASFRQAIALAPAFVFGHYNLGHTLFLQGRFLESCAAYEAGLRCDTQKNGRQACRLALARAGSGDVERAREELSDGLERVAAEVRGDVLDEVASTLEALATLPGLPREELASLHAWVRATPRS